MGNGDGSKGSKVYGLQEQVSFCIYVPHIQTIYLIAVYLSAKLLPLVTNILPNEREIFDPEDYYEHFTNMFFAAYILFMLF